MDFKAVKLDRRHAGFSYWNYYVSPVRVIASDAHKRVFLEWREWCWSVWGPSKELDEYSNDDLFDGKLCSNSHWCWLNDPHGRRRIYLRDDIDLTAFSLRWS